MPMLKQSLIVYFDLVLKLFPKYIAGWQFSKLFRRDKKEREKFDTKPKKALT